MQKITIIGNLGKDPEERFTANGKKVIGFSVAVRVTKETSQWYDITIWEDRIPTFTKILSYLKKGSRICVMGDLLSPNPYTAKDGNLKVKLSIRPDSLNFVGSSADKSSGDTATEKAPGESKFGNYI